ncbi:hypothetical protein [Streptomyces litmocidini]|uniref:Uncharacterized protein n=1 Tax=Streptomyces litmocidini TaxID=67318 RepID=A0ABW7U1K6_9ACTN
MQIRRWLPDQPTRIGRHDWPDEGAKGTHLRLQAGSIVVLDRQAWRVLDITGYPGNHWPESYEKAWRDHVELWWHANELRRAENQAVKPAPERAEFYKRPVVLVLRDENLPRAAAKHWCAPASQDWQVLPEHYAVCRACGELPPCHHGEYRPEGGPRRPEQSGGIPLLVPEGCCMGCAEEIKPRMRTVRFPGPNLWYPDLGDNTAIFHARSSCEDQVEYYRAQWQSEYAQPAAHPAPPAFPGFDHFVLPRARRSRPPVLGPVPQHGQVPPHGQDPVAAPHPQEETHSSLAVGSGTFSPSFEGYRAEPEPYPSAPPPPSPAPQPAPAPAPTPPQSTAPAVAAPVVAAPAAPAPVVAAPAPVGDGGPAGPAVRAAEELSRTLTERPAFHNAEQAARVIEELTAAVRNIALCLNNPQTRTHP